MKKPASQGMARFNRAAFRVGAEILQRGGIELLLEDALTQVFGRLETGTMDSTTCTEFTCNVYAPPPPNS